MDKEEEKAKVNQFRLKDTCYYNGDVSMDVEEMLWRHPKSFLIWHRMRRTYLGLSSGCDEHWKQYTSYYFTVPQLAEQMGLGRDSMNEHIKVLYDLGLLYKVPWGDEYGNRRVSWVVIDPQMENLTTVRESVMDMLRSKLASAKNGNAYRSALEHIESIRYHNYSLYQKRAVEAAREDECPY